MRELFCLDHEVLKEIAVDTITHLSCLRIHKTLLYAGVLLIHLIYSAPIASEQRWQICVLGLSLICGSASSGVTLSPPALVTSTIPSSLYRGAGLPQSLTSTIKR